MNRTVSGGPAIPIEVRGVVERGEAARVNTCINASVFTVASENTKGRLT